MLTCQTGSWSQLHEEKLACAEGVALLTGGQYAHKSVEVWGPNGEGKTLSDLPSDVNGHSVDYFDGALYLCYRWTCWKGEYDVSSKGISSESS